MATIPQRMAMYYYYKNNTPGGESGLIIPPWYQNILDAMGPNVPSDTWKIAHINFGNAIAAQRAKMDVLGMFSTDSNRESTRVDWINPANLNIDDGPVTFLPEAGVKPDGITGFVDLPVALNQYTLGNASYGCIILAPRTNSNDAIMANKGNGATFMRLTAMSNNRLQDNSSSNSTLDAANIVQLIGMTRTGGASSFDGSVYANGTFESITYTNLPSVGAVPSALGRRNTGQYTDFTYGMGFYGGPLTEADWVNITNAWNTHIGPLLQGVATSLPT